MSEHKSKYEGSKKTLNQLLKELRAAKRSGDDSRKKQLALKLRVASAEHRSNSKLAGISAGRKRKILETPPDHDQFTSYAEEHQPAPQEEEEQE